MLFRIHQFRLALSLHRTFEQDNTSISNLKMFTILVAISVLILPSLIMSEIDKL